MARQKVKCAKVHSSPMDHDDPSCVSIQLYRPNCVQMFGLPRTIWKKALVDCILLFLPSPQNLLACPPTRADELIAWRGNEFGARGRCAELVWPPGRGFTALLWGRDRLSSGLGGLECYWRGWASPNLLYTNSSGVEEELLEE